MKNLNVTITNEDFVKFSINKEKINFPELVQLIKNEISKQNLSFVTEIAEKYGLSEMTMDEINAEVKAIRDAKVNH